MLEEYKLLGAHFRSQPLLVFLFSPPQTGNHHDSSCWQNADTTWYQQLMNDKQYFLRDWINCQN